MGIRDTRVLTYKVDISFTFKIPTSPTSWTYFQLHTDAHSVPLLYLPRSASAQVTATHYPVNQRKIQADNFKHTIDLHFHRQTLIDHCFQH